MTSQEFVQRIESSTLSSVVLRELVQAVLARGEPFHFEAKGPSMSPFIQEGDTITIAPLAEVSLGRGDVVAFLRPDSGKLVVHRVVDVAEDCYLIRGDNADRVIDRVSAASILGRVTDVRRDGKRFRLGLGPERRLVALLSRRGLLRPLLSRAWPLLAPLVGRLRS